MAENSTINDTELADKFSRTDLAFGVTGLLQLPVILTVLLLMIFMYKTYRTTFQRLILFYVILGLWFQISCTLRILLPYTDERWVCIIVQFLYHSSLFAYDTYIVAITNFSLLLIPCLMKGRPVSKRISKYVECICVALTAIVATTAASILLMKDHSIGCTLNHNIKSGIQFIQLEGVTVSIFLGMDLEVVLVGLSLCFAFCFIRRRIHMKQTAVLLRNSVCHVAINAIVMGVDSLGTGYDIYMWSTRKGYDSKEFLDTTAVLIWNVLFVLAAGVSAIIQAILCIQTSTERNTCCKRCCCMLKEDQHYAVIDGKDTCTATNPASSRISQPSYTHFTAPYTGAFANTDSHGQNEQRPLIGCTN